MAAGMLDEIPVSLLLESIPSLLLLFDPAGRLAMGNGAARSALGISPNLTPPEPLRQALAPAVRAVLAADAPVRIEQTRVRVGASERVFGFNASPVRVGGGVAAVLVTGKDITDHVNLNREIRELEAAAQAEKVVRKVSHELRNPLNAVRGYAQVLTLSPDPAEEAHRCARVIITEVDRMDRILQGLRDLSGACRLELTVGAPEAFLRGALQTAAPLLSARGIEPEVDLGPTLPKVLHDPARLHQVILNLLKNAAEAVGFGGRICLRAGALESEGFWAEVADDGPGVDPELGDRIFELFVTTKPGQGEGIGLAVCQEIVHHHGGRLTWASGHGGGAVFRVEIPAR